MKFLQQHKIRGFYFQTLVCFVIVLLVSGCKKLVTVAPPENLILGETVFRTSETANAAALSIYAKMVEEDMLPYSIPYFTGLLGDELRNYSNATVSQQLYKNQLSTTNSPTDAIWNRAYRQIYQANTLIEGCVGSPIPAQLKQQLTGEGKFVRAFWHFYLFNLYGEIPVITTTDYKLNSHAQKQSKEVVYAQIIKDLKDAEGELNAEFVSADGVTVTEERVRPNRYAASALLARAYLYNEQYADAVQAASKVIANIALFDTPPLGQAFLKNSKEAIWQLIKPSPNATNINTQEGFSFILLTKPRTFGTNESSTLSPQLLATFEGNDLRLQNWVGTYTDASTTPATLYRYPAKYKVKSGSILTEYSSVLRLSEQYLIRAEALARQQKAADAIVDLDVVRKRAEVPLISVSAPGLSGDALIDVILHERRVEFFCEWGHRWMDMKRTGTIDNIMPAVSALKGGIWTIGSKFMPIPLFDRQNNPNL